MTTKRLNNCLLVHVQIYILDELKTTRKCSLICVSKQLQENEFRELLINLIYIILLVHINVYVFWDRVDKKFSLECS